MKQRWISLLLLLALALALVIPARAAESVPFTDLPSSHWAYSCVKDLYEAGVVSGTSQTTFDPRGTVTLGQSLKLILLAAGYEEQAPTTTHWASGYFHLASQRGLLGSAASLTLDQSISRLQIAQIAAKALGCQRTNHSRSPFSDTMDLSVLALYDHGIFLGVQEGDGLVFKPKAPISRAEAFTLLSRMQPKGWPEASLAGFSDAGAVPAWAKSAVASLVGQKVVSGANGMLLPNANVSRAEVAKLLVSMW